MNLITTTRSEVVEKGGNIVYETQLLQMYPNLRTREAFPKLPYVNEVTTYHRTWSPIGSLLCLFITLNDTVQTRESLSYYCHVSDEVCRSYDIEREGFSFVYKPSLSQPGIRTSTVL